MNFKVMQIVMQRKIPFCARRGAELGEAGPGNRFARARWRGSAPGASSPAGRAERSRCGLQDAFGAVRRAGCRKRERCELGSSSTSSTLPGNGSPRRRSEPARERCCQEERGGNRERKSFSLITNHLLPLSAIQGRNKIVLSFPLESSTGTEK